MSIMITGGTGFLGSYLARHLIQEKGETGIVLFDMYPNLSRVEEIQDRVAIVQGDVLEPGEILAAMKQHNVDRVVHLAFILGGSQNDKFVPYLRVQCMGTANVFEACRIHGVSRVVYASSVAVYGGNPNRDQEVDEDVVPKPRGLYGACKLWMEHIAEEYNTVHGLDVIGLRPTSVFGLGRGQRGSYASRLTPIPETPHFMVLPELAALGEPITMPPDDQETDWIYAADAAEAWYCALEAPSPEHKVFNMRSERRRIGDVTAHLRRILPDAQISVSDRPVNLTHLMNNERLRTELGFRARYTMETGLVDYLNRVRSQVGLPPVAPA
jgi:nucleoside-diphosphate-sugar epimerase